jgi:hypothetical protein
MISTKETMSWRKMKLFIRLSSTSLDVVVGVFTSFQFRNKLKIEEKFLDYCIFYPMNALFHQRVLGSYAALQSYVHSDMVQLL